MVPLALAGGCSHEDESVDVDPSPARDAGADVSLARDGSATDGDGSALAEAEVEIDDAFDPFGNFDRATPNRPDSRADRSVPGEVDDSGEKRETTEAATADVASESTPDVAPEAGAGCTTTACVFAARSPECAACAFAPPDGFPNCLDPAQIGFMSPMGAADDSGPLDPCALVTGESRQSGKSEAQFCLDTLDAILHSDCAADGNLVTCLCGSADGNKCQSGAEAPLGDIYALYQDDFGNSIHDITTNFASGTRFGASVANNIAQCLIAYPCDACFKPLMPEGGTQ